MAAPRPIRNHCILLRQTVIAGLAGAVFGLHASASPFQEIDHPPARLIEVHAPMSGPWLDAPAPTPALVTIASTTSGLPDAPSTTLAATANSPESVNVAWQANQTDKLPPCPVAVPATSEAQAAAGVAPPTICKDENPLRSVVNSTQQRPLTSSQKGYLAIHEVIDPFSLIVLTAQAGITIGANAHTAYGPGLKGFGSLTGYSLLGDATGAFFGTYAIPSLVHEDPRYRRMQNASIPRRFLHAISRTVIAQHDDGRLMPNYATLLTYPITAELSNLYVPGVPGNGPSTMRRIGLGLATDPIGNIIGEFLPDIARHIHVRSIFVQQIINQMIVEDNGVL